jgi:hypothetical protein
MQPSPSTVESADLIPASELDALVGTVAQLKKNDEEPPNHLKKNERYL